MSSFHIHSNPPCHRSILSYRNHTHNVEYSKDQLDGKHVSLALVYISTGIFKIRRMVEKVLRINGVGGREQLDGIH